MPGSALIGNLAVNLSMETAAFQKGADIIEKRVGVMQKRMTSLGKTLAKTGVIMTAGVTLPLVAFGKQAFKAASDAAELDAAFGETFGKLAGTMDKWAEATGNAMGRSTREIKEGANAFGLYFNQAAKTRVEAAKMSQQFTVLAQDLASFHNTGVDEALVALRSGLSGETEPMRRFGVFLNEAAVAAKAAEMGFEKVNGKLTDQQKIMARSALILEQTSSAQGDVARTSESTANQIRRSQAAWEELQITVGTKLLPVLTPLIEKLGNILTWFSQLSPATQTWIVGIGAASAVLGPFVTLIGGLIAAFGALLPLLLKIGPALGIIRVAMLALLANPFVLGAAALITGIYLAWKHWDQISAIVQRVYTAVKTWLVDKFDSIVSSIKQKIDSVTGFFRNMYVAVVGNSYVPDMIDGISAHFQRLGTEMVEPAAQATAQVMNAFRDVAGQAISDFGTAIADAALGTKSLAESFADMAKSIIHHLIEMTTRMLLFRAISGLLGGHTPTITGEAAFNATAGIPGFASGGSGIIGGLGGVDRNIMSINGTPVARVSKGERFSVSPANDQAPQRVILELRDDMLEARIANGANIQIVRASPMLRSDAMRAMGEVSRRRG